MIRRPPRSTRKESSAASDVYKRQLLTEMEGNTKRIHDNSEQIANKKRMIGMLMHLSKMKQAKNNESDKEAYKTARSSHVQLMEELTCKDREIERLRLELRQAKEQVAVTERSSMNKAQNLKLITPIKCTGHKMKKQLTTQSQITLCSAKDITSDSIY
eukprot:TRINITY_DN4172_c0_g2_i2.p1 TRINITY_DN4172_c0_g2~~TRINITY_DN4172_c0_g2_i2.p1  ORF type:complete len:171 (-),score=50.09 TRINITY_DN4172_c0_g2_i2:66-539(-)